MPHSRHVRKLCGYFKVVCIFRINNPFQCQHPPKLHRSDRPYAGMKYAVRNACPYQLGIPACLPARNACPPTKSQSPPYLLRTKHIHLCVLCVFARHLQQFIVNSTLSITTKPQHLQFKYRGSVTSRQDPTPFSSPSSCRIHYESQTSCNSPQAYSVYPVVGSKSYAQSSRTSPCFQTIILKIVSTPYLLNMYNSLYQQKHLATSHVLITIHPAY